MAETVVAPPEKTVVIETSKQGYGPSWSAEPTFGQTAQAVHVANGDMHLLNSILTQFGFANRETSFQGSEDREAMRHEGRATQKELSDHRRETERGFGTLGTLLERGFGHTNEELAEGIGRLDKSISVEACQTREVIKDRAADIQLEAAKNAAAAALAAATNTAALQASLAACCCEIKERIGADGQATRDLINAQSVADLRERLATANAALLSAKAQVII